MRILSIETSCDETAVAVLEATGGLEKPEFKVLGNSLMSQIHIHEEYGGVVPNLAKREHEKNLPILLARTLKEASVEEDLCDIDFIAVTQGPGLEPALWTGITFAEELGNKFNKPVVPVDHMEGHIYSVLYNKPDGVRFPALALLVSGGHTEMVLISNFGSYNIIGKTRDDAVGEAFDKVARMLNLGYPGGPKISALAAEYRASGAESPFVFPRPMLNMDNFDFSFSGLKTAVLYKIKSLNQTELEDNNVVKALACAFEDAAVETLVEKTRRVVLQSVVKTLVVGGGVAANKFLRESLQKMATSLSFKLDIAFPEMALATDNAVMIGIASYIRVLTKPALLNGSINIRAQGNLMLGK